MDLATIVGLIGGFIIVGAAIVTGGDPIMFVNIPSILIVIGGSLFVVNVKNTGEQTMGAMKAAAKAFMFKIESPKELIDTAFELSEVAKKEGPLALEKIPVKNSFFQKGIDMLVDGHDAEVIETMLNIEKRQAADRHSAFQKVFMGLGDVAPAMGMIGTLIGLVQMLSAMDDPKSIGPAMAVALLTTLYGAIIANMVAIPIADKLKVRSEQEQMNRDMMIQAVMGISKKLNSRVLKASLENYMSAYKRPKDEAA